jgi:hypothetical protein
MIGEALTAMLEELISLPQHVDKVEHKSLTGREEEITPIITRTPRRAILRKSMLYHFSLQWSVCMVKEYNRLVPSRQRSLRLLLLIMSQQFLRL